MFSNQSDSILPEAFFVLTELFETSLSELRFPNVDALVLRSHIAEVAAADSAVKAAEEALQQAKEALREREQAALERGERALSYLRIYLSDSGAVDNDELAATVAELRWSKPIGAANTAPKRSQGEGLVKRRGRPRKSEGELFDGVNDSAVNESTNDGELVSVVSDVAENTLSAL